MINYLNPHKASGYDNISAYFLRLGNEALAPILTAYFTWAFKKGPAVSSVAKRTLPVREVWGSIPGPVKSAQCRQRLATVAAFLRSCVAQALSRGDGPRNSLHASA